jgi:hypothetical protein
LQNFKNIRATSAPSSTAMQIFSMRNFARRVQELRIARAIRHHRPHNPV